jgi:MFS family permease
MSDIADLNRPVPALSNPVEVSGAETVKPTRVRYAVLAIIFLLAVITYLDRVCISIAAPFISTDLRLNPVQMGAVFSIFALAYALFEVPTGWMGDRFGARKTLARVVIWWSVFTVFTGLSRGYHSLLTIRFLFGAGEAGAYPNITRAMASWFPLRRRGTAMGIVWMGSRLGAAISPPLVLFLITHFGWRGTFYVLGVVGLLWAVFWIFWYRDDPAQKSGVNEAELRLLREDKDAVAEPVHRLPFRQLFSNSNLVSIYLMYFTLGFVYYLYITWFPTYLMKARGLTSAQMGVYASLPLAFSAVATMFGGLTTDWLVRRIGLRWGRAAVGIFGCSSSVVFLVAGLQVSDVRLSVLLIALSAASSDFTLAASWSTCADIGGRLAGTISGTMNMVGNVGSMLSPLLMGYFIERFGNWNLTFYIAAGLNVVGMILWLKIDASKRLKVS